jgi:uncharacterized protein (TIGR02145 family)
LSSNATIRANFETATLTVNQNPTAGGTVTPSSQQNVAPEIPFNISATPASGYRFLNWTVTSGTATIANANSANTTVTLSSNATIRANFELVPGGQFNPSIAYSYFTDSRDGQTYRTVTIGSQTWMAENLNWAGDGDNLGACYDNNSTNCDLYGRLYDWNTVMAGSSSSSSTPSGVQGICPAGWHVPSDAEWTALTNIVGGVSMAGTRLKAASPYWNGTDGYGFSALPAGAYFAVGFPGGFSGVGTYGGWWSATAIEFTTTNARGRNMFSSGAGVERHSHDKSDLLSLRCVR